MYSYLRMRRREERTKRYRIDEEVVFKYVGTVCACRCVRTQTAVLCSVSVQVCTGLWQRWHLVQREHRWSQRERRWRPRRSWSPMRGRRSIDRARSGRSVAAASAAARAARAAAPDCSPPVHPLSAVISEQVKGSGNTFYVHKGPRVRGTLPSWAWPTPPPPNLRN